MFRINKLDHNFLHWQILSLVCSPEKPCDSAFIPSVVKRMQRWRVSWISSVRLTDQSSDGAWLQKHMKKKKKVRQGERFSFSPVVFSYYCFHFYCWRALCEPAVTGLYNSGKKPKFVGCKIRSMRTWTRLRDFKKISRAFPFYTSQIHGNNIFF